MNVALYSSISTKSEREWNYSSFQQIASSLQQDLFCHCRSEESETSALVLQKEGFFFIVWSQPTKCVMAESCSRKPLGFCCCWLLYFYISKINVKIYVELKSWKFIWVCVYIYKNIHTHFFSWSMSVLMKDKTKNTHGPLGKLRVLMLDFFVLFYLCELFSLPVKKLEDIFPFLLRWEAICCLLMITSD